MNTEIKFPIIDISESLFESERAFFSYAIWETNYTFKEKHIKNLPDWKYVDSEGKLLNVKIFKQQKIETFLSFLFQPKYHVELQLVQTGKVYQLEELKDEILKKKYKMFQIYHNKTTSLDEYEKHLRNAKSFLEIIDIASFEDYKSY